MIGQRIAHYQITGVLGKGGMGTVYRADDSKLKRTVALKFLSGEIDSREARVRFLREAQAAAGLHHPRICTIHEIGEHEGSDFIVMALAEGRDLRSLLSDGPLNVRQALDVAIQIAEGLEFAHSHGIVHRDIKPANVMVGEDGRTTIMDFGLAKLSDATAVTRSSATLGTPWYMAPEQVRAGDLDARADLWSLGVILFEMLSGRRPFDAERFPAVLNQILNEEAPKLSDVCEGVPQELDWIVAKCLTKAPQDRYSTAAELRADLLGAQSKIPPERGETLTVRARPRSHRRRSPIRVAAAILIVLAVAVAGYRLASITRPETPTDGGPDSGLLNWSDPPRVAVVSFENQTGDPSLDFVSTMSADEISTGLASTELVEVVPLQTESSPETAPLAALLQSSGADLAITGTFYRDGDGIAIQTRVVDARSAGLIFSVPGTRAMREAPRAALQSIAERVAGGLAIRIDNPFSIPPPAVPPRWQAFAEYQAAMEHFLDEEGGAAVGRFRRAAALDSLFVRPRVFAVTVLCANAAQIQYAYADAALMELRESEDLDEYERAFVGMLSEIVENDHEGALNMALRLESIAPEDKLVRAMKMIRLSVASRNAEALQAYYDLDLDEDLRRRAAVAGLNRTAGDAAHAIGRYDEELRLRRELLQYYPDNLLYRIDLLGPFAARGEVDSMHVILEDALARPGNRGFLDWHVWTAAGVLRGHGHEAVAPELVNWYIDHRPDRSDRPDRPEDDASKIKTNNFAGLLYHAERWTEARTVFEAVLEADPSEQRTARLMLGFIAAREGDRESAEAALEEWLAGFDDPYRQWSPYLVRASFAAVLGDLDEALRHLQQAAARGGVISHRIRHDFDLQPLLGYPPFEAFMESRTGGQI